MVSIEEPPFRLVTLPGKGVSVIATRSIPASTLLFSESPVILVNCAQQTTKIQRLFKSFSNLSEETKTLYIALCNGQPITEPLEPSSNENVLGIWKTNAFSLDGQGLLNGIFSLSSRLNHACVGSDNCRWEWDVEEKVINFYTDRDTEPGEELTHCYRPDWRMGTKNRREALFEAYGFLCVCTVCESEDD
ncbi:hypothetical protein RUND412_001477 [Rhizina undulata]